MKKALAILMIFALVASVAMAEVTVGAWGRGIFVPASDTGADGSVLEATEKATWGGSPRVGFTVSGSSDNVGFVVELKADYDATDADLLLNDQQKIWVKPIDMLKFSLGRVEVDTLRGNAAFGSFNWDRDFGANEGEDVTFTRISTGVGGNKTWNPALGFVTEVTPMDALFIGIAFCDVTDEQGAAPGGRTTNLFKNIQVAAGYTIEGIGQIRAQYIGEGRVPDADGIYEENAAIMEMAFKFTMIENLYADVGFRMPLDTDLSGEWKNIALYANYKVAGAVIHALGIFMLGDSDNAMNFAAGVDYEVSGIGLEADLRYYNDIWTGSGDARIAFFVGAKKGFSNGLIGAGLEIESEADMGWAIPIRMEYWF
jgi:hypothetical protein